MPRYIVERTFVDGLQIPTSDDGVKHHCVYAGHDPEVNPYSYTATAS